MDAGTAQVVAACVAAVAAIVVAVIGVQLKVHSDNRSDHGETAAKVDRLLDHQSTIQRDVQYIRADVTDIHGVIRELRQNDRDSEHRISVLEQHQDEGEHS